MARPRSEKSTLSLLLGALLCAAAPGLAQGPAPTAPEANAPASFDASDVYFQGWLLTKDAEKLHAEGRHLESIEKLRRARELFDTIRNTFPDWRPEMVQSRLQKTFDQIAEISPDAFREQQEKERAIAELEGGARRGGETPPPDAAAPALEIPAEPTKPAPTAPSLESRRIAELETEVRQLQQSLQRSTRPPTQRSTPADPVPLARQREAERQRDLNLAELQRAQAELDKLRRKLAEAPVQEEMLALGRRIDGLEREKEVMAQALETSRAETRETRAQVDALQQERGRLMQEVADLKQSLELERETSNQVVAGQRRQIEHFQNLLKQKDTALAQATRRIQSLESELAEVRESVNDLSRERDQLLRERDQMAALLKLNESGQLQQVIDQNLALDRELRQARERYDELQEENDATKEDLVAALRDLAISKLRIQEFRREREEQEQRLSELRQRLRHEEDQLATSEADPAEVEMLRSIIQRQLKIQEKREQARELLLSALGEKATQDEEIQRAMAIFQGAELNLSPDEMRVLDAEEVDGVIISPYARPRDEVERSLAGLERDLTPYRTAAVRAFQNGRLLAARETFEMIVERHPGDSATMCKLGLVELKLDNPLAAAEIFRRASEVDPTNPYAHRMLGHASSVMGANEDALAALRRAADLSPTHAETHILLGNLLFRMGRLEEAEEAFLTAIACDEALAEPRYNLAVLQARLGRPADGYKHYLRALELGAPPNLELEQKLRPKS